MKSFGAAVRASTLLSVLAIVACGDTLTDLVSEEDVAACMARVSTFSIQPARELIVDVPADPPAWFEIDWFLIEKFSEANGRGFVGFKEAKALRLLDTGIRSAASAEAIRSGLIVVCRLGGEITSFFRSTGSAAIRIDPEFAPSLRLNPFIDYIEPNLGSFTIASD
jgi:hypothetical protein